mgnify:CR=1 FL=1
MSPASNRPNVPTGRLGDTQSNLFGQALGAASVVDVPEESLARPAVLARLARSAAERLRSSGGRPTDPDWTLVRQVPFSQENWGRLGSLAHEISEHGRRVAPAQLAAMLVEDGLDRLNSARDSDSGDGRLASSAVELDEHLRGADAANPSRGRSGEGGTA